VESVINTTVEVPKWNSDVNVTVGEIIEGIDTVITINVTPENATGKVLVEIDGVGYYVNLTNGSAELPVKDLDKGNHTISVVYLGDDKYNGANMTRNFTVEEPIGLKVIDNETGTFVNVTVPGNATGNITIRINNTNYTAEVINGTAIVNITNATPGVHNVTVIYKDNNGTEYKYNTTIDVPKYDVDVGVNVTNAIAGAETEIIIKVDPTNATGIVLVDIDGKGYYVNMTNGSAELTLDDLPAGNHTAVVTFMGNDLYNNKTVTKDFSTAE
jgi:hypothetical protein